MQMAAEAVVVAAAAMVALAEVGAAVAPRQVAVQATPATQNPHLHHSNSKNPAAVVAVVVVYQKNAIVLFAESYILQERPLVAWLLESSKVFFDFWFLF